MKLTDVLAAVESASAMTGAAAPERPDGLTEGYSRLDEPGRYRVLDARVAAWAQALAGLGLADTSRGSFDPASWARRDWSRTPAAAVAIRPRRPDALPLLIAGGPAPEPFVAVGAGDPAVLLSDVPVRGGRDACANGAANPLATLDELLGAVVSGALLRIASRNWTITSTGDGWSATGDLGASSIERELAIARVGVSRHDVLHGPPWW